MDSCMLDLVIIYSNRSSENIYLLLYIKRLFSTSSLSAIRVVSSACLRLLIFLLAILIPACASSSPEFHMMYSVYKLNKQGDNIQLWGTPFSIWNQSVVPCPVLTVASWPAYRFLRRQVRWSGIPISLKLFKNKIGIIYSKIIIPPVSMCFNTHKHLAFSQILTLKLCIFLNGNLKLLFLVETKALYEIWLFPMA